MKRMLMLVIVLILLIELIFIPTLSANHDPISTSFDPIDDTYISQSNLDSNYGSNSDIHIRSKYGPNSWESWRQDALINFDLSSLPSNVYINYAKLYFYYYSYQDNDPAGRGLSIYRLGETWSEDTATWNSRPTNSGKLTYNSTVPTTFGWMTWNLTTDIQEYVNGNLTNYGWQICDKDSWGQTDIPTAIFSSKENSTNAPYLEIEYYLEEPNQAPVANAGGPYTGYVNESTLFYGYLSSDADGSIVGYKWDFENDGIWDTQWRSSSTVNYIYNSTGNHTIVLQVKDDDDAISSNSTALVNISQPPNKAPDAKFSYEPTRPSIYEDIVFTDSSSDSDGTIVSWYWDFDDGINSTEQNPVHNYSSPGNYTVTLTVTDNGGLNDTIQKEINVTYYKRGDINLDGNILIDDYVLLLKYLLQCGPEPDPFYVGDINSDGLINFADLFYGG